MNLDRPALLIADDREAVFGAIRTALAPLKAKEASSERPRAAYPSWGDELCVMQSAVLPSGLWETFATRLRGVNGVPLVGWEAVITYLADHGATHGYIDPRFEAAFRAVPGADRLTLETHFDVARPDDYDFGITQAAAAIAESGTLVFTDALTSSRLGALAPWIHIAVVHPDALIGTIPEAIRQLGTDPNVVWATGPSKTADVEGILIEGVHGPGVQIACLLA